MIEIQQNQQSWLPVIFQSLSGTAVTGVLPQAVVISIKKADTTGYDFSGTVGTWVELTGAAYQLQGYYNLLLTSSQTDVTGIFQYCAYTIGAQPYFGVIKIAAGDTTAIYNRLGVPNYGTIKDDIANVGVTAGSGGFTAADRAMLSATFVTSSRLPTDPASNSYLSGVMLAYGFLAADRSTMAAIKLKTDYLPSDPASNSYLSGIINAAQNNINTNTNNDYNSIVGSGFTTNDSLRQISLRVTSVSGGMATPAVVNAARDYLAGVGFVTGIDDLHNISLQIQGITPSSGGGGFSTADRAALYAAYSATINLPADPTSWSTVNSALIDNRARIMGSGVYGPGGGDNRQFTLYQVLNGSNSVQSTVNNINTYTSRIPTSPAAVSDVNAARDYLAGPGYVQASDSLHVISTAFTSGNFTVADRTTINSIYSQVSGATTLAIYNQVTGTVNNIAAIKNKTDNLPNDPVSTVHMDLQFAAISGALGASGSFSNEDRLNILTILTSTNRIPLRPADADVTFGANDRTYLNSCYGKTINLPPDPASITYVQLVSQSLGALILNLSSTQSSSFSSLSSTVHSGVVSTSQTVDAVHQDLLTHVGNAETYGLTTVNNTNTIITKIGTPSSGSISDDIRAIAVSVTGVVVDLSPVLKHLTFIEGTIGTPITDVATDIKEVARLVTHVTGVKSRY